MKNEKYHIPVLLNKSIQALNVKDNGIYVDATLGGGGHSKAILESNDTIRLFSFDRDSEAINYAEKLLIKYADAKNIIRQII